MRSPALLRFWLLARRALVVAPVEIPLALAIFAAAAERRTLGEDLAVILIFAARPVVAARMLLPIPPAFGSRPVELAFAALLPVVTTRTVELRTISTIEFRPLAERPVAARPIALALFARAREARALVAATVVAWAIETRLVETRPRSAFVTITTFALLPRLGFAMRAADRRNPCAGRALRDRQRHGRICARRQTSARACRHRVRGAGYTGDRREAGRRPCENLRRAACKGACHHHGLAQRKASCHRTSGRKNARPDGPRPDCRADA